MKCLRLSSIVFSFLILLVVNAHSREAIDIPQIPYEQYIADRISEKNRDKECPALNYWGARGVEWGMTKSDLQNSASPLTKQGELKIFENNIRNLRGNFGNLPCEVEAVFDRESNKLSKIRRYFAGGLSERPERLAVYKEIKRKLMANYNAPTHNIHPDEIFRGEDAYVQGLDETYHVEWHGPETIVSLKLSDTELVLEYRQAPTSKADIQKERVKAALIYKRMYTGQPNTKK